MSPRIYDILGEKHPNWKGNRKIRDGRVTIYSRGHPNADNHGYVKESRLVAERAIGRFLKKEEVVHHINGNKLDNRNCNLLICTPGYHQSLHGKMRKLKQIIDWLKSDISWPMLTSRAQLKPAQSKISGN